MMKEGQSQIKPRIVNNIKRFLLNNLKIQGKEALFTRTALSKHMIVLYVCIRIMDNNVDIFKNSQKYVHFLRI